MQPVSTGVEGHTVTLDSCPGTQRPQRAL